jgi:hypothetical protein
METIEKHDSLKKFPIKSLEELSSKKYSETHPEGTLRLAVIAMRETRSWSHEIQEKAKGPILGLFLVDLGEPTNLCSFDVNFFAHFIRNHFVDISTWQNEDGEWLPGADDELSNLERENGGDNGGSYFNEHSKFYVITEIWRTDADYSKELDGFDNRQQWIDHYIEYYLGNTPL